MPSARYNCKVGKVKYVLDIIDPEPVLMRGFLRKTQKLSECQERLPHIVVVGDDDFRIESANTVQSGKKSLDVNKFTY